MTSNVFNQLRGAPNVRSGAHGNQLTELAARQLLEQLRVGNAHALNALDPVAGNVQDPIALFNARVGVPAHADPFAQGREYGIIVENGTNEAHIVVGTSGSVDWADLTEQGLAVAHLHPLVEMREPVQDRYDRPGRSRPAEWKRRWEAPNGGATGHSFQQVLEMPGYFHFLLPTIGDIIFCAQNRIDAHTVYTPYGYHNQEIVDPHSQPNSPLLNFVLKNSACDHQNNYTATIETWADANMLNSHTATVSAKYTHLVRQTIYSLT